MIHYHVWFSLKPGVREDEGLTLVRTFIAELTSEGLLARGCLLKNTGEPPRSRLPRYHALFEFADDAKMDAAFSGQRQRGIHTGTHGRIVEAVAEFHVEVFREIQE